MRHWFPEDSFDTVGRLPHKAADRAFSAFVTRATSRSTHAAPDLRRTVRFALESRRVQPGSPPRRRRAIKLAVHHRKLSQPVLPHRQERLLNDHNAIESPADFAPPDEQRYRDADGLITMCVACHLMQRPGTEQWDRVPQWEASPPAEVTGGLCVPCFQEQYARYLPKSDDAVA